MKAYKNIDEYIANFSKSTQTLLTRVRATIHKAAPKAMEKICYGIPTFTLFDANLVHFAGYEKHIGFYPGSAGIKAFTKELKEYKTSKGAVQFPIEKPLPLKLVTDIVKFRVKQDTEEIESGFLLDLSAPAERAMRSVGVTTVYKLAKLTEEEIRDLHGVGPSTLPVLRKALKKVGLKFKK